MRLNLTVGSDDAGLTGSFSATDLKEKPAMQFNFDIDSIDLDRYMAPEVIARKNTTQPQATQKPVGTAKTVTAQPRPTEIPVAPVRGLNINGDFDIGELIVKKARLRNIKLRLNAQNGVLNLKPVFADLYEGKFSGDIKLDVNPKVPKLTVNAKLKGVQAEPLLKDLKGKARLRGKGDFSAALFSTGKNNGDLKRNLNGQMSISFSDGAITGFNLGKKLRQWKQFKKGGSTEGVEETESTDFLLLTGHPVAKAGVIRMDDLNMKAPAFRLAGKGELANLHSNTISYTVLATIANTSKGAGGRELVDLAGLDLPVNISGPLEDPKIQLDWGGVLAGLFTNKLKEAIPLPIPGVKTPVEQTDTTQEDPAPASVEERLFKGLKGLIKNK